VRLLLDTCTFLWLAADDPALSARARALFQSPEHEVYLSVVSAWEITVKHALGRLPLPGSPSVFVPAQREALGVESLPLDEESVLHAERLQELHRDPFDRMLVCQAIVHGLTILTPDPLLARYPARTLW
jgi:PIN domain nuclease of toxin-antitoxin system